RDPAQNPCASRGSRVMVRWALHDLATPTARLLQGTGLDFVELGECCGEGVFGTLERGLVTGPFRPGFVHLRAFAPERSNRFLQLLASRGEVRLCGGEPRVELLDRALGGFDVAAPFARFFFEHCDARVAARLALGLLFGQLFERTLRRPELVEGF